MCYELNPPFSRSPVNKDVTNCDVTNHLSPKHLSLMKETIVRTTGKPEGTDCDVDYYEAYLWSNMALRQPRYRYSFTKSPSVQFAFVFLFAFSSQLWNRLWCWNRMFRWNDFLFNLSSALAVLWVGPTEHKNLMKKTESRSWRLPAPKRNYFLCCF